MKLAEIHIVFFGFGRLRLGFAAYQCDHSFGALALVVHGHEAGHGATGLEIRLHLEDIAIIDLYPLLIEFEA